MLKNPGLVPVDYEYLFHSSNKRSHSSQSLVQLYILQCNDTTNHVATVIMEGVCQIVSQCALHRGKFDPTKVIERGRKRRGDFKLRVGKQNHTMVIQ